MNNTYAPILEYLLLLKSVSFRNYFDKNTHTGSYSEPTAEFMAQKISFSKAQWWLQSKNSSGADI